VCRGAENTTCTEAVYAIIHGFNSVMQSELTNGIVVNSTRPQL
jgi:hypothetical protein